nr:unnamed protein product [Spirometra erinaceieuropaei]
MEARKLKAPPTRNSNSPPLIIYPRCQRIFRAWIRLVGHFQTPCTSLTTLTAVYSTSSPPTLTAATTTTTLTANAQHLRAQPPLANATSIIPVASSAAATTTTAPILTTEQNTPNAPAQWNRS